MQLTDWDLKVEIEAFGTFEPPPIDRKWLTEARTRADDLGEPQKTDLYTMIAHLEKLLP